MAGLGPAENKKSLAVVGAGPAGLAFSCVAAERGHEVTLFDSASEIGGQFNMAKRIPGKEEFYEALNAALRKRQKGVSYPPEDRSQGHSFAGNPEVRAIQERLGGHAIGGLSLATDGPEGALSTWDDPEGLLSMDDDEV